MSFYNYQESGAEAASAPTGSIETGVYKCKIDTVSKTVAKTGTVGLDWSFELDDGRKAIVYGFWIQKADGSRIFNADILDTAMWAVGATSLTPYNKEIKVRDGVKTVEAMRELDGKECYVALQVEKGWYNGEETSKLQIKAFFNKDGKTFSEAKKNAEPKQMKYYEDNLKDKYTKEWKMANAESPEPASTEPTTSLL